MSEKTNEMLENVGKKSLRSSYTVTPEYTPENLREGLGLAIAFWCEWTGADIMEIFASALEDANYHTKCGIVRDWIEEEKG